MFQAVISRLELPDKSRLLEKACKMKPSSSPSNTDASLSALRRQLNLKHPLGQLAETIDWQPFEEKFGRVVKLSGGRPALPTQLMVGLHYLKSLYNESDESVVTKWYTKSLGWILKRRIAVIAAVLLLLVFERFYPGF